MAKPIYIYTGTEWVPVGPQIGNIAYNWIYTATGSETSLSGTDDNGLTLSYTPNYEQVYLNGVLLTRGTDYTTASSSSITGLSALTSGDVINVLVLETTTVDNTYTQNQVDVLLNDKADLASPALTGTPTAPTATQWDASTQIATTEFVNNQTVAINQFGAAGSSLLNLPSQVHPAEKLLKQAVWYIDSAHESAGNQEISNLGWGGNVLNAQSGSTTGADSNDPKYLDWDGENYVYLPGVTGNYLSVPDEAALDITGDIDIRIHLALDSWQPASTNDVFSKYDTGEISWNIRVNSTSGYIIFYWSTTGSSADQNAQLGDNLTAYANDGESIWLRITLDVDNGAGGNDVKFYYAPASSDVPSSWTQIGSTVTGGSTTSIYSGASDVRIGARQPAANNSAGSFYRAQVLDGINGTPVLDVDTSMIDSGSDTSFPALTGQTVTINRSSSGRKAVAVTHPCWLFGSDDSMEVADNDLIDFGASDSFTVLAVVRQWATPINFNHYVSKRDGTTAGYLIQSESTSLAARVAVAGGGVNISRASTTYTAGQLVSFASVVDRSTQTIAPFVNAVSNGTTDISTVGDPSNALALKIGVRADSLNYQDFEFIAAAVFRKALTAGEIATLTNYFNGRTGG